MKKLKIILLFSLIFIYISYKYQNNHSIPDSNYLEGYILDYKIDGPKLFLEIKGKTKIISNYYFKTKYEKKIISDEICVGCRIVLYGNYEEIEKNRNFNLFNYKNYLKSKKIFYKFKAKKIKIKNEINLKNKMINRINKSKNKKYLKLFILGENDLDENIKNSYRINGISHLFAISGMHITLFTTFVLLILNKVFKSKKLNFLVTCILLIFYASLTNCSASIIRAILFFMLLNIKNIYRLSISAFYLLILIMIILLIYNPFYIYNLGFIYSFIISLSLIYFNKELNNQNYIRTILKTSAISFLVSFPINIFYNFEINFLSPLLNIFFVPFISFVIFPMSIINFIYLPIDSIYTFLIKFLESISITCSKINFMNIILCKPPIYIVAIYYIGIINLIKRPNIKKIILSVLIILIHSNVKYLNNYPIITMIDIGQGDSILIELPHNQGNILVDTGGNIDYNNDKWRKKKNSYSIAKSITIPYLKSIGIKKIDYLILTHGDYDHMGEAINLVNNFKVEKVIFNCGEYNEIESELIKVLDKKKIKYYSCIKELNIDKNKLYFLQTKEYYNENDNSNVIYTELNRYKFMFMGDAGIEKEKDILDKYNISNIDVLKVGHHGSKTSSGKDFINEINPKYSIISVGKNNRYGHPNKEVLDNLEDSKIYRTDQNGSVILKIKNNKLKIETCLP